MKINKYPDGTSYVNCDGDDQTFTFKLNTYEDLWHLTQAVDAFNSTSQIPIITIPNLIDAQADRRFNYRESSGLKLVCKHLNNLKAKFRIFHPHNSEVVEALIDNVEIISNEHFINEIELDRDNLILMSTDAGGFKPLIKLANKLHWKGEIESASKSRKYKDEKSILIQKIDRQDFEGKNILLIDDICVYGGTFKGLAKMLKERNCGKLYLAISHLTIQNHKGDDSVFNYFDKVFTTNSKYDEYYIENSKGESKIPENLEIIKLF